MPKIQHLRFKHHKKKYCKILSKIQSPEPISFIEKVFFSPITLRITEIMKTKLTEIILYSNILVFKHNAAFIPIQIPRHDLLDFTSSVSNGNFINKHLLNALFYHSPMINMSAFEILFEVLEWRSMIYAFAKTLKTQIFIYLTKENMYIYSFIDSQNCILNLSNFFHLWQDSLQILQLPPSKCISLQKCLLSITNQENKMCILIKTAIPLITELEKELIQSQFNQLTRPVLGNRCHVLTETPDFIQSYVETDGFEKKINSITEESEPLPEKR